MNVQRLGKDNYDEIICLMNTVFGLKNGKEMDFERDLPKMCVRDEEHMRKHFGIFEDGKLVACLGVYPLKTVINGEEMLFATMGNVVTHPDYEGRGYMTQLLERGSRELDDLNVDAARLGGLRSRYNRYGFEICGQEYRFTFTSKNRERRFPDFKDDISFVKIEKDDTDSIVFATDLYNQNQIAVKRTGKDAYLTMTAWRSVPYIALKNGKPIGYFSVNEQGDRPVEVFSVGRDEFFDIICGWQKKINTDLTFSLQPHRVDLIRVAAAVSERLQINSPSQFYIRNWEKAIGAFLRLKASYADLPKGELVVLIDGQGYRVFVTEQGVGCEKNEKTSDTVLDGLSASRYIFGPTAPVYAGKTSALAEAWFPLPLGWNGQDRV